jgi:hypothetical protein
MQHLVPIHKNDFVKDIYRNLAYNPLLARLPDSSFSTNDCLHGIALPDSRGKPGDADRFLNRNGCVFSAEEFCHFSHRQLLD